MDQSLGVLCLHGLGYPDHGDDGCGRPAEKSVSTPSTTSTSILAVDSLSIHGGSVTSRAAPVLEQDLNVQVVGGKDWLG